MKDKVILGLIEQVTVHEVMARSRSIIAWIQELPHLLLITFCGELQLVQ